MGNGLQFIDIIVFAVFAGFLVLRLRSVLGRRTGREAPPNKDPFATRPEAKEPAESTVVQLPQREPGKRPGRTDALAAGITQIKIADPGFSPETFAKGARAAFEAVVEGFAKADHDTLRALLADDVYASFARAISDRAGRGETLDITVEQIKDATVVEAAMDGTRAQVTVKFVSQQTKVTRDDKGKVIDGDPAQPVELTDIWTFARETRSRNPNWTLIATDAAN